MNYRDRFATETRLLRSARRRAVGHSGAAQTGLSPTGDEMAPGPQYCADATDKFKEIAEAYAVLSDQTKRRAYDTTGHAGVSERWSTEDIFRDFDWSAISSRPLNDVWSVFGNLFSGRPPRADKAPGCGSALRFTSHLWIERRQRAASRRSNSPARIGARAAAATAPNREPNR